MVQQISENYGPNIISEDYDVFQSFLIIDFLSTTDWSSHRGLTDIFLLVGVIQTVLHFLVRFLESMFQLLFR